MSTPHIYCNGQFIKEDEAAISPLDRGFLYGDGLFETMRSYNGRVFRLESHIERLSAGLEILKIEKIWSDKLLSSTVYDLLELNSVPDAYIRLTVTRGAGGRGIEISGCGRPTILIQAKAFNPYPESSYSDGVDLCIAGERRNLRSPLDARLKSLNFLNNILARLEMAEKGAFETVMLNGSGYLTEGTVSNIFFFSGERLCTPSLETGILDGITRDTVLGIASQEEMEVEEGFFTVKDLFYADEVFVTNSMIEVMPVSCLVGSAQIRSEKRFRIGRLTEGLIRKYRQLTDRNN